MITLLNAAPDTGNQGVSALCLSAVAGLAKRGAAGICVADHGRGRRAGNLAGAPVDLIGLTHTRRYWREDSLTTVRMLARQGGRFNAAARAILQSDAVLDVSGGDSFTDLYGPHRFNAMVMTKQLALDNGLPLILLPQTLGPFRTASAQWVASGILQRARAVWVRDAASFEFLKSVLGRDFDPDRHRLGVDMAVALPQSRPVLEAPLSALLDPARAHPVAGLNVSGLLTHDPEAARRSFGLTERHDRQIRDIALALLRQDPALHLLLVPHVHRAPGHPESDLAACLRLTESLPEDLRPRVTTLTGALNAMELKWVLSRLDWFAGARMHATIGAFSSGTPTLGLGYSDKAAGVFAQCGLADHVADLRVMDSVALAERARLSYLERRLMAQTLAQTLPELMAMAEAQMDRILLQIAGQS